MARIKSSTQKNVVVEYGDCLGGEKVRIEMFP